MKDINHDYDPSDEDDFPDEYDSKEEFEEDMQNMMYPNGYDEDSDGIVEYDSWYED